MSSKKMIITLNVDARLFIRRQFSQATVTSFQIHFVTSSYRHYLIMIHGENVCSECLNMNFINNKGSVYPDEIFLRQIILKPSEGMVSKHCAAIHKNDFSSFSFCFQKENLGQIDAFSSIRGIDKN